LALDAGGDSGESISTRLQGLWKSARDGLKASPRDARLASELKALAPALAIACPEELGDLVEAVLSLPDLMVSTREVLQKDFDRALVIAAREASRHSEPSRHPEASRHPERSEGSSLSRHPERSEGSSLSRHPERSEGSSLASEINLCKSAPVALHCRAGLAELLLDAARSMKLNARSSGR